LLYEKILIINSIGRIIPAAIRIEDCPLSQIYKIKIADQMNTVDIEIPIMSVFIYL